MDLRRVRSFIAAAEELHLGRAARTLGRSEAALANQIAAVESEIGTRLINRLRNGALELTPAGRSYVSDCRRVLSTLERAAEAARHIAAGRDGVLRLGLCEEATTPWLTTIMHRLRATVRGLHFELTEASSQELATALRLHRIDVALVLPGIDHSGLIMETLWREPWLAVLLQRHPLARLPRLTPALMKDELLILGPDDERPSGHALIRESFIRAGIDPQVAVHGLGRSAMLALCTAGFGATFVPRSFVAARVPSSDLVQSVPFEARELEIAAAYRAHDPPGVAMQFLKSVRRVVREAGVRQTGQAGP
ncbi:MAG: LysR family transcriptional regulator [Gammaproteobacteria bacterium]|nr:LysR family transcriptional regulator [Gammaproteobacteria bacterium]